MKFVFSLFLVFTYFSSSGQHGFSASTVYDAHILTWANCVYKPTIGFRINYLREKTSSIVSIEKRGRTIINFGFGYERFSPMADTLYYLVGKTGYGAISYSTFPKI